jgi:hypothetical protein
MRLIYVNEIGSDYKGQRQYEFIFSESTEIDMDEWFDVPASSTQSSKSPDISYIDLVGLLKDTDIVFELIQNSDYFGVIDAVDGIIAMAWEKSNFDLDEDRMFFRFGETVETVEKKLLKRGLTLDKQEIKN